MENWTKHFLLTAGFLTASLFFSSVQAQEDGPVQVIEPDLDRRSLKEADIDTENIEVGFFVGVVSIEDFSTNEIVGGRFAYHATEDLFFEATYGSSEGDLTSFERLSGGSPLLSDEDREYTYYDLSVGWNMLPGEAFAESFALNSAFYVIAGIGSTEFAGDSWFTINLGIGYRVLVNDFVAWHFDAKDRIFDRDTLATEEATHNVEFTTGITVFF